MKNKKSITLYCFTPLVSLATFFVELIFGVYVLTKYRRTLFGKLSVVLLVLLGIFQLSEYQICRSGGAEFWTIIGYIAITFLPALGVHLVTLITKKSIWTIIGYIYAGLLDLWIIFAPNIFSAPVCSDKFVIFNARELFSYFYSLYYLGFLFIGICLLIQAIRKNRGKENLALIWTLLGYASFIVPTAVIYIIEKTTRAGAASIMCGFAVFLAIILVAKILPEYQKTLKK